MSLRLEFAFRYERSFKDWPPNTAVNLHKIRKEPFLYTEKKY